MITRKDAIRTLSKIDRKAIPIYHGILQAITAIKDTTPCFLIKCNLDQLDAVEDEVCIICKNIQAEIHAAKPDAEKEVVCQKDLLL